MSEEPRKRSRFDQTEPEPKKASRFDRRSRSPSTKQSESRRSRSPLQRSSATPDTTKKDPAAAAAAAAAKINASLESKKGIQHVDVPPIRASSSAGPKSPPTVAQVDGEIYQQDGDYIKDIEVNDLRNRYTLTKGATQKMIKDETGADVTTRGNYYPDKSMATPTNPPLYLHVTARNKDNLETAVKKIEEMMTQELPNLVDERRFRRPREPEPFERDEHGRRKWPEERIPIDLEPIPGFNLRAQVVGHGGTYVKHIQSETRCRVQIKGRGSGFFETNTGQESDEPMYLHVAGPDPNEVKHARELCEDLLGQVKQQYQQFKERGGQRGGYGRGPPGGGGDHYGGDRGGDHYSRHDSYGGGRQDSYSTQGYGGEAQSPATAQDPNANPMANMSYEQAMQYAEQYAQYFAQQPGGDPYAAYGGYVAYVRMYYQYYAGQGQGQDQGQAQAQAQGQATPGGAGYSTPGGGQGAPGYGNPGEYGQQQPAAPGASQGYEQPPPPPPSNDAPPPPPPGGSPPPPPSNGQVGSGGYGAVPPPPGM